jgi:hypothetical protein
MRKVGGSMEEFKHIKTTIACIRNGWVGEN